MDKFGIAFAMMSNPGASAIGYDGSEKGNAAARQSNEYGAKLASQYPKRIGFFAAIPMNNTDGALKEIEYALDTLKADGFQIGSSTGDKWPGDPQYLPIFQEISRRKASVFVHPYVNKCCKTLMPGIPESVVEYDLDTTRCVTSMLYNGTLSSCPDMKFIVNHSGAAVPMLAGRIKDRVPVNIRRWPHSSNGLPAAVQIPIAIMRGKAPTPRTGFSTNCASCTTSARTRPTRSRSPR